MISPAALASALAGDLDRYSPALALATAGHAAAAYFTAGGYAQILRGLCKALGHRLDAVEARLLRPAGQISVREIMEQAKAEAPEQ